MRSIPSFSALRAFEAAARLGGFALAARELHLTPSAVSHQVKSLEQYFGRQLFVRRHRQVTLTRQGSRLLEGLNDAFDTIEVACAALRAPPSVSSLAVHCTPSFASKWLGPRLPDFMQRFTGIQLQLSSSADPIDLLRRSDLDMVVAYGTPLRQSGIEVVPLGTERICVLAAPAQAAALKAADDVDAWRRVNLIDSILSPVRWDDWLVAHDIAAGTASSRTAFDRGALSISAAAQGLGLALETTRFAEAELQRGELEELAIAGTTAFEREVHFLCYRENDKEDHKIKAFRTWLLAETHARDPG